jgi:hypothetical protein
MNASYVFLQMAAGIQANSNIFLSRAQTYLLLCMLKILEIEWTQTTRYIEQEVNRKFE